MSSEQISAAGNLLFVQDSTLLRADLRAALLTAFNLSGQGLAEPIAGRKSDTAPAPEQAFSSRRTAEQLYAAGQFQQCSRRLESDHAALNADELRLLAACSLFTGDNQRASNAASALEALQPHSLEALYWSIQANERLALKSLARFQQMEPDSARSHVLLGDMYHQLERNDDAQAEYLKALALAPDDPAAMLGLAWAYFSNNNIAGSMETARRALVRSPEDPELNLVLAQGLMSHKEFAAAEPYLEKSLHAKPQMLPRVHALIGQVYAETGRTQPAVEQLKMGASSDEDGTLQYLLARLYHQLGDEKDASAALQRMKEIKRQRSARGVKAIEDPDLSALEATPSEPPKP
jgi:tetratricopeptide (TPR) repeat protein